MVRIKLFLIALLSFFTLTSYAMEYQFDPKHTHVLWHANHFGFSNPSGKWMVEGTLYYDEKNIENSKVRVTIPMGKLQTGMDDFNSHLKVKDFFNVKEFPEATFVSEKITRIGTDTAKVEGLLTLRGVSKPVTLEIKLNKKGINPFSEKETLGFSGHTTLKRSDFGLTKYIPDISDEVKIEIEAEAYEATPGKLDEKNKKQQ